MKNKKVFEICKINKNVEAAVSENVNTVVWYSNGENVVRFPNGPVFVCHLNTGLSLVWYSDHHFNAGPILKWWYEYLNTTSTI